MGSNSDAAKIIGINVKHIKLYTYIISGLMCIIAGILLIASFTSITPHTGSNFRVEAIGSTITGYVVLGGRGGLYGSILGAILILLLSI
ncbi:MAG: hypothetical protein U5N58_00985 [Actinomycetota bacterium]|nr:hypothetical protein [Actinomycetota bacterium]